MSRPDHTALITLWGQGLSTAAIAARLGIPPGTARSRVYALQQRGLLSRRPSGGYRHGRRRLTLRAAADTNPDPVDGGPVQSGADAPVQSGAETPSQDSVLAEILQELQAIKRAVQSSADVPGPSHADWVEDPEDAKAERWNLWIPRGLRRRLEAEAARRGMVPSKLVQVWLGQALASRLAAPP